MNQNNLWHELINVGLDEANSEAVTTYQKFVKEREGLNKFSRSETINRIITEWAEDRHLTLEVAKKK